MAQDENEDAGTGTSTSDVVNNINGVIQGLTAIVQAYGTYQQGQTNAFTATTNAKSAAQQIAQSKATVLLNGKYYTLAAAAQKSAIALANVASLLSQKQMGLNQEQMRLNQTKQVEDMLGTGTTRAQSETTFQQGQQDRRQNQKFLSAMAKGVAAGLSNRSSLLPKASPVTGGIKGGAAVNPAYAGTPTIAGAL